MSCSEARALAMLGACANAFWNCSAEFENHSEYLAKANVSIHMLAVACVYSGATTRTVVGVKHVCRDTCND